MLRTLSFVLPVLMPSWRFFKTIEPSPRMEYAAFAKGAVADAWHALSRRPETVTPWHMIGRLFWNPAWNDALFMVSCAERIAEQPTDHSINEITQRIRQLPQVQGMDRGQFRLTFVSRICGRLHREVVFVSDPFALRA